MLQMRSIFVSNIWKIRQQKLRKVLSGIIYVLYDYISSAF